ncbi:hypothetical protein GCM10015535_32700 [Streptomyces gelaticus]|uniref:Uncharacterized protein n=1 Tax=Streptomyces gelaticus TaxID=285446 RepID=A0ABQ2VZH3_9ACTN|nr:hypothetical protein GCM10015535_32700 [Streptomyces gelaticus]
MQAQAFPTWLTRGEAATRNRAASRVERWQAMLSGMSDGRLTIGSRTPVAGLPAWVTPEVKAPAAVPPVPPCQMDG